MLRSIWRQRRHFALITAFASLAIGPVAHSSRRLGKDCAAVQGEALLLVLSRAPEYQCRRQFSIRLCCSG